MTKKNTRPTITLSTSDKSDISMGIPVLAATATAETLDELRWYVGDWVSKGRIRRWASRRDAMLKRMPATGPHQFIGEDLYRVLDVIDSAKTLAGDRAARVDWAHRRDTLRAALNDVAIAVA